MLWEEVLEFVGSKVCLDGNARYATAHRSAQANKSLGEVETRFEFFMTPKKAAPEHCKNQYVAGFSLEFERVNDGQGTKRQNCELECENGERERDMALSDAPARSNSDMQRDNEA